MSHNYPYRRQPLDSSLRSDPGSYSSSGRPHDSPGHEFSRTPQESYSSSHQSSSSSSSRAVPRWSEDGAFSVLSSCGLEPSDLALLAEMPEDALTVESLPQVLRQIKGKRGTVKPFLQGSPSPSSSSSSYAPSSTGRPAAGPSTSDWDHLRSRTVQYPTDHLKPSPHAPELDRWGNPIILSCVKAQPSSSSSSSFTVDFQHRAGPSEYGKTCRDPSPGSSQNNLHRSGTPKFMKPGRNSHPAPSQDYSCRPGPASSQNQPSFSSAGNQTSHPPRPSQPGPAGYTSPPAAPESHLRPSFGRSGSETSTWSSSQSTASLPSRQNALDFHGATPPSYPHSCSLCAITVMSDKVWLKHINGPHHADGQLCLLQKFPSWDCRMETVDRVNNQPEQRREEEKAVKQPQTTNQNSNPPQPNTKTQKKSSDRSKVVCVKFPAHAVDEAYLRKLAEPFGKVVKILMFPSLAFVELGSMDQAKDLVKFHSNYPPTVNGELMEFRISNTFNFLQSSSVVSFFPAPSGDGQSDLISIVKRFGSPLYTLFLPSRAFVEMKDASEAQKIVNYYASNNLRINDDLIKVSFSGEYRSLMRVPSAKRYEEETKTRRRRSRTRSRSRSKEKKSRTRSKSRERRTRSRSREKASRVRSRSGDRSRSRSREKFTNGRKSKSREKSAERHSKGRGSRSKSRSREKPVVPKKTEMSEPNSGPHPVRDPPGSAETEQSREEAESTDDDSDIEGMAVIGEDGESVEEDEMETLDEAADGEETEERSAERTHSPDGGKEEEEKGQTHLRGEDGDQGEAEETTQSVLKEEEQREQDFPVDLDSCITLDELDCEDPDEDGRETGKCRSRVLYFSNVPLDVFTDAEFIKLVRDHGTAVQFLRVPGRQTGFIEMSSSAEAQKVRDALTERPLWLQGCTIHVEISSKYPRLFSGCSVDSILDLKEEDSMGRSQGSRRSDRLSKSRSSDRDESSTRSEGRKSSSKRSQDRESETPHRKSSEKTSPEKKPERPSRRTPENESTNENESNEKTPETESTNDKTPETESTNDKTPETESTNDKTPETESTNDKTPETESTNDKTPETESRLTAEESQGEKSLEKGSENSRTDSGTGTTQTDLKTSAETNPASDPRPEKESSETRTCKRGRGEEDDSVPEKKDKKETEDEGTRTKDAEGSEKKGGEDLQSPDQQDSTGNPPRPQTEQKPADPPQVKEEPQSEPVSGPEALQRPLRPVGTEFVRPVVGYFCNLCQVIYADEDEAKQQHCSSEEHYRKYQEKTGKDPRAS